MPGSGPDSHQEGPGKYPDLQRREEPPCPEPDLLDIDDQLSDEERLIRDTVRAFTTEQVLPHVADWFEAGTLPREIMPELGKLGLLGMHLTGYGCAGARRYRLRSGLPGTRGVRLRPAQRGLGPGLADHVPDLAVRVRGAEDRMAAPDGGRGGDRLLRAHRARPRFGSGRHADVRPAGRVRLGAVRAPRCGSPTAASPTSPWCGPTPRTASAGSWCPRDARGFTARDIHKKLSLRASITSELHLDDVRLPADAVLPGVTGLKGPLSCLSEARFGIAWGVTGAARTCLESAIEYARTREQFGKPIGSFQLTQAKLSWMAVDLYRSQLLALHLGRLKEAGSVTPVQVSIGKMTNVRSAIDIARQARTVLGASGVTLEYPPIRHANNLEAVLTYEGTEEIHLLAIGQALTGISAYR